MWGIWQGNFVARDVCRNRHLCSAWTSILKMNFTLSFISFSSSNFLKGAHCRDCMLSKKLELKKKKERKKKWKWKFHYLVLRVLCFYAFMLVTGNRSSIIDVAIFWTKFFQTLHLIFLKILLCSSFWHILTNISYSKINKGT